jgi:1-acyl-sn-glycerol-3-phosphate acyltransferase
MSQPPPRPVPAPPSADPVLGPRPAPPARAWEWLPTLPFLVAFGGILVAFDPAQRLARLFGQRPQEVVAGALQTSITAAFRLCGTRLEVERHPEVRPGRGYILLANHQSMFDIPILGSLLPSNYPKYVSKRELGRGIPSISYNLRRGGHALIDRADRGQAVEAIRALAAQARARDVSVVLYPEGTRSRAGELRAFKPAGALALFEAAPELPVVPVAIDESWKLLAHNLTPVPWGVRVRVHLGAPIARDPGLAGSAILERAQEEIAATLRRWRTGHPEADDEAGAQG